MRFKVELHGDVQDFVWDRCTARERVDFRQMCRRIAEDPILHSEPATEPRLSRYILRFARFGQYIAIFGFDRARKRVRIRKCRRLKKTEPDEPRD